MEHSASQLLTLCLRRPQCNLVSVLEVSCKSSQGCGKRLQDAERLSSDPLVLASVGSCISRSSRRVRPGSTHGVRKWARGVAPATKPSDIAEVGQLVHLSDNVELFDCDLVDLVHDVDAGAILPITLIQELHLLTLLRATFLLAC